MITMYTDGASRGNPGRGGYGTILIYKQHRKELSAGFRLTTNNRMELLAVIVGLEAIKKSGSEVRIFSDSQYVVHAVNRGWIWTWERKNYKGRKNIDLWRRFMLNYQKHDITFEWIKGHSGIPENERCDELAVASADGYDLLIDEGYEKGLS